MVSALVPAVTRRLVRLGGRPGDRGAAALLGGLGVGRLGIDQLLQLTAVEEDTATLGALVDLNAVALVTTHRAVTFGAGQLGCHCFRLLVGVGRIQRRLLYI